jgi:hypothetical protein
MRKAAKVLYDTKSRRAARDLWVYFGSKTARAKSPDGIDDLEAVMITPTHLKDLRNAHLSIIWRRAEEYLRSARQITFIGYSLPGDDLHVKYLLKRAIETRARGLPPPSIVVVDKGHAATSTVRRNYERFFGRSLVSYHGEGFDKWATRLEPPGMMTGV